MHCVGAEVGARVGLGVGSIVGARVGFGVAWQTFGDAHAKPEEQAGLHIAFITQVRSGLPFVAAMVPVATAEARPQPLGAETIVVP